MIIRKYEITERALGKQYYNHNQAIYLPKKVPIEQIHEGMKLLGFNDIYTVSEENETLNGSLIYRHPKLAEIDAAINSEIAQQISDMTEKCKQFNKLPEIVNRWNFPNDYRIVLKRGEGTYSSTFSRERIQSSVFFYLYKDDKQVGQYMFDIERFISSDKRVLKKSFLDWNRDLPSQTSEAILSKIMEMIKFKRDFRAQWST